MTNIRVLHNKDNPYAQINRKTLQRTDLSWEARGLWAYLLSLPNDWKVSVKHLIKQSPGGRDKVWRILNDLKESGLCILLQRRQEGGKWAPAEYIIAESQEELEEFKKSLPHTEKPSTEKPGVYKEEILHKSNIKISKEMQKPVAGAPLPLLSFGEFKRVKLTQEDYDDLEKRFGKQKLQDLITAVDGNLEERGITRKNYKATLLNWERREKTFNPISKREDIQEKNKSYAQEVVKTLKENLLPGAIKLEAATSYLEIGALNHPHTKILNYSENGFKEQFENELRRMDLFKYLT